MAFSRRDFLKSTSMVALGSSVPMFLSRTAAHAAPADRNGAKDTILVVVQLTGGNDGLNTVVPFDDDDYAKARPTLRIRKNEVHRIDDKLGLHPAMEDLSKLLDDQSLCVVQGVGYPNPTQSHFRSMDIWQAGNRENLNEGWIGKALRGIPGATSFHLADENEAAPLALNGAPVRVPSISSLQDFQVKIEASSRDDRRRQLEVIEQVSRPRGEEGNLLDFVRRTASSTYESSRRLAEVGRNYQPRANYPNTQLGDHLRLAAQLIDTGIGARLFYVTIGGFDTHSNQANAHASLLRQVSEAISAFYRDMKARGQGDRVLVMTFSEFGRRVRENGSRGTDHGAAAPMMLVGGKVKAGLVGEHPSLKDLERGNLQFNVDFRRVYATLLDKWLGVASRPVLGKAYEHVGIFNKG